MNLLAFFILLNSVRYVSVTSCKSLCSFALRVICFNLVVDIVVSQELCAMAGKVWDANYGTLCVGINWELFRDRDHALVCQ